MKHRNIDQARGNYRVVKFLDSKGVERTYISDVGTGRISEKIPMLFGIKKFKILSSEPLYLYSKDALYSTREKGQYLPRFNEDEI